MPDRATQGPAPLRVVYQGAEESFSHVTARRHFAGHGGGVVLAGCETFRQAADAVREGRADRALLPIENTTAGSVHETDDLLAEGGLAITGEVVSRVEHCLLALPGVTLGELRTVISHPQALAQCERFLNGLEGVRTRAEYDTAGAARQVRDAADRTLGAIAGESAARAYGLAVLRAGIQTQGGNATRFVELARDAAPCPPGAPCKTTLLLELPHRPGALGEVLVRFGAHGVNLARIESRPIPDTPWRYRFHLDLEGHAESPPVRATLEDIRPRVTDLRVLGTYPRAAPVAG